MNDKTNGISQPISSAVETIRATGKEQAKQVRDLAEEVLALGQSYHRTLHAVADDMEGHSEQTAEVVTGTHAHMSDLVSSAQAKRDEFVAQMNALASRFHRMPDDGHVEALRAVETAIADQPAAEAKAA